jgi:hypothetical protein
LTGTTFTETTLSCLVFLTNPAGTTSYTGDGTSGIYIFGAQLSDSASVDPYVYQPVAAPTSTAYFGPRFDYDPVTLAPKGLLIEEQRTNLVVYSEQFDNAAWVKNAATVTANSIVAPDGTLTADTVADNAVNTAHCIYGTNLTVTATTTYAMSVYLKAGTLRYASIRGEATGPSTWPWVTVDLQTGSVNANASVASSSAVAIGNGWYRLSMTFVNQSLIAGGANIVIAASNTATAPPTSSVLGNAYVGTGATFYAWGVQLEAGAFATSYIPTVASQVTRAVDSASMIGNNFARWYNVNEGTLFTDAVSNGGTVYAQIGIGSNSADRVSLYSIAPNFAVVSDSTTSTALGSATLTNGTLAKLAGAYKVNDFALSINGATVLTDAIGLVPNPASLLIGARNSASPTNQLNGTIKRIAYYNRRLANTELQGITS